jgi:hypothetical protein
LTGGGSSGNVTVSLASNSTNYIQNTSTLQSGATFYVSSGTVSGQLSARHFSGATQAPTIAVGAGAGTTATASVTGSDAAGEITLTSTGLLGTLSATVVTVTFNSAYASAPYVVITPSNGISSILSGVTSVFVTPSTGNFLLTAGTTPLPLGTYKWQYHVIQ